MSETLTDFLLARIAEDEEVARAVNRGQWYPWDDRNGDFYDAMRTIRPKAADHIARHGPARALAECEAKRAIVEHLRTTVEDDLEYSGHVWFAEQPLRYLALPYADHPDYREEWRP